MGEAYKFSVHPLLVLHQVMHAAVKAGVPMGEGLEHPP